MAKLNISSVIVFSSAAIIFFIIGKHANSNSFARLKFTRENSDYPVNTENFTEIQREPVGINYLPVTHLQYQNVTECNCLRPYFYPIPDKTPQKLNSTCSDEGSLYQPDQKVITMTMYFSSPKSGLKKLYNEGLQANLKSIKEHYPGHTFRLYTNVKLSGEYCDIYCKYSELLWCDIRKTPSLGDQSEMFFMSWRFLTLGDPSVDYFLSRDLDSVIIEREVAVVRDWLLNSDKAFHLMRDKQKAHNIPILGGLWGAKNSRLGFDTASNLREKIIISSKSDRKHKMKSGDQFTLNEVIFYPRKKDIVAYDCCHCVSWRKHTEVRAFPMQRENNINAFVGNYNLGRKNYTLAKCPTECRPDYGKEWEYC